MYNGDLLYTYTCFCLWCRLLQHSDERIMSTITMLEPKAQDINFLGFCPLCDQAQMESAFFAFIFEGGNYV